MPLTTRYIVMGVAGCGKSHIGKAFAERIGAQFVDGDDLHPSSNIAKMSKAIPLTDTDRAPWLVRIGEALRDSNQPLVIACSALKRTYRETIRNTAGTTVQFLFLDGTRALLLERMSARNDHFMPTSLLDSQLQDLERPEPAELALTVSIDQPPDAVVTEILAELGGTKT